MTYDEAMERFGHDAPDLRFGMELVDITDLAKECEFRVFRGAADAGGRVRGINAKGAAASYSRKDIDELTEFVMQDFGAKGLAWFKVEDGGTLASPIAKNFTPELLAQIGERMQAKPGDLLLFVADKFEVTCKALYAPAQTVRRRAEAVRPEAMHFSWVVEFPMFAWDDEEKRWAAMHHPFTAPRTQDFELLEDRSGQVPCAGLRPGDQRLRSRRRHDPNSRPAKCSSRSSRCWASTTNRQRERFGFLLDALAYRRTAARRHRAGHRPLGDAASAAWTTSATASPSPRRKRPPT